MEEMNLTGEFHAVNVDFTTNAAAYVTFKIKEKRELMRGYMQAQENETLKIDVKTYRPRRSNNANAYAWKLITEIADILRAPKDAIYFRMLKRYGQSELISVLAHVPIGQYVKYYEDAGTSTLDGQTHKHYRVYKGSSEFNTREMSILIDGIVAEAKEMGIQTETPEELARLKALWKE